MLFFLAQPKASNLKLKSPTSMTLSERLLIVSNSLRFRISSRAVVNGSQNEILVARKVKAKGAEFYNYTMQFIACDSIQICS